MARIRAAFLVWGKGMEVLVVNETDWNSRYDGLKGQTNKFLIALNSYQNMDVLPNMIYHWFGLILVLGCENVVFSIYENGSQDLTRGLIRMFRDGLRGLRVGYRMHVDSQKTDWKSVHRIEELAKMRNLALAPIWDKRFGSGFEYVVFFNDVVFGLEDVLELVYQAMVQKTALTCGMDYADWPDGLTYYDVWVGRDLAGRAFYPPYQGHWQSGQAILQSHVESRARYEEWLPFQVFSCWNGLVVIQAKALVGINGFRRSNPLRGECSASECQLLAKDLQQSGHTRVMVVPRVSLTYEHGLYEKIAQFKQEPHLSKKELVEFVKGPEKVACYPLEGIGRFDADWAKEINETIRYKLINGLKNLRSSIIQC